jgi:hypothetical protein
MTRWTSTAVAVTLLSVAAPLAHAQAPLAWKHRKGDQFPLSITTDIKETTRPVGGKNFDSNTQMTLTFDVTVREAPRGGNLTLGLRVKSFEAKGSKQAEALKKLGSAIKGQEFSATVDRAMKLDQLKGMDTMIRKLAEKEGLSQRRTELAEKLLTVLFRSFLEEAFVVVPDRATVRGDTWQQTTRMDLMGFGFLTTTKTYTDEGASSLDGKETRKLGVKGVLRYTATKAGGVGLVPGKINKFELKNQEYRATVHFDNAMGRAVRIDSRMTMDMVGNVTVNELTYDVESRREQTFRIQFGSKAKSE